MVEHSLCMRGARGSIPRISIILFFFLFFYYILSPSYYLAYLIFFKKRQWQDSNLRSRWKLLSRQPPWPLGHIVLYHYIFSQLPVLSLSFSLFPCPQPVFYFFQKTTVAGFEPTHPEDNWFQVNRLRPLGHTVYTFLSFVRLSLPFSVPFIYPLPIPTLLFFILPTLLSWLASYSTFFPFYFCNLQ